LRSLPIAPQAPPSRRHLAIAGDARDIDRAWRPVYAVWEVTLACDLARRHCGSRAGKVRPDELTTAEALDLVTQMADLGVKEVTLIGGEAYLRDDWLDIVRAVRARGMMCTVTTGARAMTRECARVAAEADEPEILLEPWQVLDVMPRLAALAGKRADSGVRLWPGNNIGYFGPHETVLRGHYPRGHGGSCGAGRVTLGIEARRGLVSDGP
jgi:hypothetical protein